MQWAPLLNVGSVKATLHHGLLLVNIVVGPEHLDFETTQGNVNDNGNGNCKSNGNATGAMTIAMAMAMALSFVKAMAMALVRYGDNPVGQSVQYAPLLPASQQELVAQDFMMHHNTSMNAGTHDTNIQNTNTHTYKAGDT